MVTFAQAIANQAQDWSIIVQIDGVGPWWSSADLTSLGSDGRVRFCTKIPSYADNSSGGWRTTLETDPDLLGEIPDTVGGRTKSGSIEFAIVDEDDYLTGLIRTEQNPVAILDGDITSSASTLSVLDDAGLAGSSPYDTLFINGEAIRVTAVASNTVTMTNGRGYLGTDATRHADGSPIYLYTPFMKGRRAELKIVPLDGDSSSDETTELTAKITWWGWDPLINMWRFAAVTQNEYLDRAAPMITRSMRVHKNTATAYEELGYNPRPEHERNVTVELSTAPVTDLADLQIWTGTEANSDALFYLKSEQTGEVVGVNAAVASSLNFTPNSLAGTRASDRIVAGDILSQVFVAETRYGEGSFRFSPGGTPSTSRSSGTWTQTSHWCDICRIIMTSQAEGDDDLTISNNYISSRGNFASLPEGYGLGIPSNSTTNLINHDSWEDVKARTLDYVFPNFVYGDSPVPFLDLISEQFLKPMGAYIVFRGGTAKIILPRVPLCGFSDITLGAVELLTREVKPRHYEPRINDISIDVSRHSSSVIYELGPQRFRVTAQSGNYSSTYGQNGVYGSDDRPDRIPVPGADQRNAFAWERKATSRLFRRHRPRKTVDADWSFSRYEAELGDVASMTLPEAPNLDGTRGSSGELAEVEEREPVLNKDEVYVRLKTRSYGTGINVCRIAPAAYITDDASQPTVTVSANRFTKSDATGGLPTTDAAAFTVTDVVRLVNRDGTDAGSGTETVDGISGNDITLSGNFGGVIDGVGGGEGFFLVYAMNEECTSTQTDSYAFMADQDRVGVDSTNPVTYGEP